MELAKQAHSSRYYSLLQQFLLEGTPLTSLFAQWVARQFLEDLFGRSTNSLLLSSFAAENLLHLVEQDREDFYYAFGPNYHDIGSEMVNLILSNETHDLSFRVSLMLKTIAADYERVFFPFVLPQIPKTFVAHSFNRLCGTTNSLIFNLSDLHKTAVITKNNSLSEYYHRVSLAKEKQELINYLIKTFNSERIYLLDSSTMEKTHYFFDFETKWVPSTFLSGNSPSELISNAETLLSLISIELESAKNIFLTKSEHYLSFSLKKTSDILRNLTTLHDELQSLKEKINLAEREIVSAIEDKRESLNSKFERIKTNDFSFNLWFSKEMERANVQLTNIQSLKQGERFKKYSEIASIYSLIESILNDPNQSYFKLKSEALLALKSLNRTIFLAEQDNLNVDFEKQQYQDMLKFLERSLPTDLIPISEIVPLCKSLQSAIYSNAKNHFGYLDELRQQYKPVLQILYVYFPNLVFEDYHTFLDFEVMVRANSYDPKITLGSYLAIADFYDSLDKKMDNYIPLAINTSLNKNLEMEYLMNSYAKIDEKKDFSLIIRTKNTLPLGTSQQISLNPQLPCSQPILLNGVEPNQEFIFSFDCSDFIAKKTKENIQIITINTKRAYIHKEISFDVFYPIEKLEIPEETSVIAYLDGKAIEFDGYLFDLSKGSHKLIVEFYKQDPVSISTSYSTLNSKIKADVLCINNLNISIQNFDFYVLLNDFSSEISNLTIEGNCKQLSGLLFKCSAQYLAPFDSITFSFLYNIKIENLTNYIDNLTNESSHNKIVEYIAIKEPEKAIKEAISQSKIFENLPYKITEEPTIKPVEITSPQIQNKTQNQTQKSNLQTQQKELKELLSTTKSLQTRLNNILSLPPEQNISSDIFSNLSNYLENAKEALLKENSTELEKWISLAKNETEKIEKQIKSAEEDTISKLQNKFLYFDELKLKLNQTIDLFKKAFTVNNTLKLPFSLAPYLSRLSSCSATVEEAKANLRVGSFSKTKMALSCIEKLENDLLVLNDTINQEKSSALSFILLANSSINRLGNETDLLPAIDAFERGYYLQAKQLAMAVLKETTEKLPITFSSTNELVEKSADQNNTLIFVSFLILFILLLAAASLKKDKKELPWVVKRVRHHP